MTLRKTLTSIIAIAALATGRAGTFEIVKEETRAAD